MTPDGAREVGARPTWRDCAAMLQSILSGARPEDQEQSVVMEAIGSNLLAREEHQKPCPTCGKPKHDFSYWRVTAAGRLLVKALEEQVPS